MKCPRCQHDNPSHAKFKVERDNYAAHLTMRWKGGALTELDLHLPHSNPQIVRTDEDTIAPVRRLATHYPDGVVAGILNRQGRKTAYGHRFQAHHVAGLRRQWKISRYEPKARSSEDELLTVQKAAIVLGVAPSRRWRSTGSRFRLRGRQFRLWHERH